MLGLWFSHRPKPWWMIGYLLPLTLIVIYAVEARYPQLGLVAPVSWMTHGRNEFAMFGFVAAMVLTTPLPRLPGRRARRLVVVLMLVVVSHFSVWPFLAPAFNRGHLSQLRTCVDQDGICRQSNDYNCGPAAAVTALRKLGLPAEEGEIAILAHTSTATGTPPDVLARALQQRYGQHGLVSEYRLFRNVAELREAGLTLVVIKYGFLLDHYVTVLDVNDTGIVVGDPLSGIKTLDHRSFERQWRFRGVILRRNPPG